MIETSLLFIQNHILPLGAFGVFLGSFLEEVIAPIPSAVIQLASGFIFVQGPISLSNFFRLFLFVIVPASVGVTFGSIFVYGLAFYFGKATLIKWGKWFGLVWNDVVKIQNKFENSVFDGWALIISRAIPIIPSVAISAFSGLIRINLKKYLIYTFFGTLVRAGVLGFVGWQVGNVYIRYAKIINSFENIILGVIILIVILALVFGWFRRKNIKSS